MRELLCFIRGHRIRVVQDFAPTNRRIKCTCCGGDWAEDDRLKLIIDWGRDLEQFWRKRGFAIREPTV